MVFIQIHIYSSGWVALLPGLVARALHDIVTIIYCRAQTLTLIDPDCLVKDEKLTWGQKEAQRHQRTET